MMLASKVELHCTVLRGENWAVARSSGSHTITMEIIPNSLVGEVNISSKQKSISIALAVLV